MNLEYFVLFKETKEVRQDLWLFSEANDQFSPIPRGARANTPIKIDKWRTLSKAMLSEEFQRHYDVWGDTLRRELWGHFGGMGRQIYVEPGQYRLRKVDIELGRYYARVHRPIWNGMGNAVDQEPNPIPAHEGWPLLVRQVETQIQSLKTIARYIEPSPYTLSTYSIVLRESLIILCTEIEATLQNLLVSHGIRPERRNWNINDYSKTNSALRLSEYTISFPQFPEIKTPVKPFKAWGDNSPSKALAFYQGYNKAKHNRETSFTCASLENVLLGFAGLIALAYATCGPSIVQANGLREFVNITPPTWPLEDHYIPDRVNGWSESRKGLL